MFQYTVYLCFSMLQLFVDQEPVSRPDQAGGNVKERGDLFGLDLTIDGIVIVVIVIVL